MVKDKGKIYAGHLEKMGICGALLTYIVFPPKETHPKPFAFQCSI